jgi:hypothetical protein
MRPKLRPNPETPAGPKWTDRRFRR